MMRQFVQITLLTGVLVGGFVPVALAQGRGPDVVATITSIAKKTGRVTLRTDTGEVFNHAKRRAFSGSTRARVHPLQPATNYEKLSDPRCRALMHGPCHFSHGPGTLL